MCRSAEAGVRSLHVRLTQMVMDDPRLTRVWNGSPDEDPEVVRQFNLANLVLGHCLPVYTWGEVTDADLLAHMHSLVRGPAFVRYWAASREAKAAPSPDSDEGRLSSIINQAIGQAESDGAQERP